MECFIMYLKIAFYDVLAIFLTRGKKHSSFFLLLLFVKRNYAKLAFPLIFPMLFHVAAAVCPRTLSTFDTRLVLYIFILPPGRLLKREPERSIYQKSRRGEQLRPLAVKDPHKYSRPFYEHYPGSERRFNYLCLLKRQK